MNASWQYDYIVGGSGIAGLYVALLAQQYGTVLLLTKGGIEDCNTKYAQGGIAAAIGRQDSASLHMQDTLVAGAGLCEPEAVKILAHEGPQAIDELVRLGVIFDTAHGEVSLAREGAHSTPRVLHAGGDSTGAHIELTLASLARSSRLRVLEYMTVTSLLVDDGSGSVFGVEILDSRSGQKGVYHGSHTILATGGAGQMFRYTTNPEVATGSGVAVAFRAGAMVMDMEFYQFHPTALRIPNAPPFLISEAVRGEGGVLRNARGVAFMEEYHALGDLAPRDVVAQSLLNEMRASESDHVLLDVTHLPASQLTARFPSIYHTCLHYGLDITKHPIPVAPAAHYMMGGIMTNVWGETSVPGLYACGEAACNGVHGANRLASNSLLDTVVFGRRLVQKTLGKSLESWGTELPCDSVLLPQRIVSKQPANPPSLTVLQELMWENVGMAREQDQLEEAACTLQSWGESLPEPSDRESHELSMMLLLGRVITEGALHRQESRGAHYRSDFPEPNDSWRRHTVIRGGSA